MGEVYRARDARLNRDVAINDALQALSRRPEADVSGAVFHARGALEAVARDLVGDVKLTLNDLKVPVKIAQEQLGHASIQTTPNIYTHVVDASHRKAIEAVERELFPSVPKSADPLGNAVPVGDSVN